MRKQHVDDKLGILDVRVRLKDGTQMDMEMQVVPFELWAERSLFYLSKIYTDQIHEGEDYSVLKKCIHVGILDFTLFAEDEEYYSQFHLWEDHRRRMYTDKLEIHILELPKLSKYEYPKTELLEWAHFFAAEKKEEFEVLAEDNTYIKKAYNRLTELSADEEKRLEYEAREKAIRDYNWQMECKWRAGHDAGVQQGRLQTLKELLDVGLISIAEVSSLLQTSEQKAEEMIKNI